MPGFFRMADISQLKDIDLDSSSQVHVPYDSEACRSNDLTGFYRSGGADDQVDLGLAHAFEGEGFLFCEERVEGMIATTAIL